MRQIFLAIITCAVFHSSLWSQSIILRGQITDQDTIMVILIGSEKSDTLFTPNGKFVFSRKLIYPELIRIALIKNKQSIDAIRQGKERGIRSREDVVTRDLFLEGNEISFSCRFSDVKKTELLMSHNTANEKFKIFQERFSPLVKMARAIIDSSHVDSRTEPEKKLLIDLYTRINEIEDEVIMKFVLENTDNSVGAYIFSRYMQRSRLELLDSIYKEFNATLYGTGYLRQMKTKIDAMYNLTVGKPVESFSSATSKGSILRLTDLRGKYVLLDFWGTWCTYCINDFPNLKQYYKKYKDRLEIVGIACDDKESDWRQAIRKYNLSWIQILNNKQLNDLTKTFNVLAYPTKVLIDDKGNLVEIFVGSSGEIYKKLDMMLQ